MPATSRELELPLGDATAGDMALRRLGHVSQVPGVDPTALLKLTRKFATLSAIYAASDRDLAAAVGDVAAARIRWFLDAPLAMSAVTVPQTARAL